jgi:hypothetical protein
MKKCVKLLIKCFLPLIYALLVQMIRFQSTYLRHSTIQQGLYVRIRIGPKISEKNVIIKIFDKFCIISVYNHTR